MYISDYCCMSPVGILCPGVVPENLPEAREMNGHLYYQVVEPDYSQWISAVKSRRMPRSVKLALAAMKCCFHSEIPTSIHIGSAYCMLKDSETFLQNLINLNEEALPPTPFIQSTHNTVSGALALELQAGGHNFTFSSRGHSFEDAFLDATLFADEENEKNFYQLVGGVEETSPITINALYHSGCVSEDGIAAGEGTAMFKMSPQRKTDSIASIQNFRTEKFKQQNSEIIQASIADFIHQNEGGIKPSDLFITGDNQSKSSREIYSHIKQSFFARNQESNFIKYCGSYPTAVSFGLAFSLSQLQASENAEQCWMIQNHGLYWSYWLIRKV